MVLCRFGFLILFIPIAIGINNTADKAPSTHNDTTSAPKNLLPKEDNSTRKIINLAAEGGNIEISQPNPTLSKENDALHLPKLPTDDVGESSNKNKFKHVVGRTGAPVIIESKDVSTQPPVSQKNTIKNKVISTTTLPPSTASKIPHKPTVLRYDEKSSIATDSTSPGVSDGATAQASKPGSHPGMIMPIVITILIVPLFAVLGYMALKRGQEAWKNRHYKRMDFLLDGMYND